MRLKPLEPGAYMYLEDPEVFRGWMQVRRMSYQDLGTLVGVSKQFIWKLAKGQKRTCRPEVAARIEMVLLPPPDMRTPREKYLFIEKKAKPVPTRPARPSLAERFHALTDQRGPDECWPWKGAIDATGYGRFNRPNQSTLAHRIAYELAFGTIPSGLVIDHVFENGCRRRDCVNPAHLEAVTHRENIRRGFVAMEPEASRVRAVSKVPVDNSPISSEGAATLQATS